MTTPEFETDARISPQGNYVSFIREQNLYVINLDTGEERAITTEGGGLISWGMAEFVAQEELSRRTGYWWSRDERYIAVARVDEDRVDNIQRLDIAGDGSASIVDQRYPRAGTDNAVVELFIFDMETGDMRPVEMADTDDYLSRARELVARQQHRLCPGAQPHAEQSRHPGCGRRHRRRPDLARREHGCLDQSDQ